MAHALLRRKTNSTLGQATSHQFQLPTFILARENFFFFFWEFRIWMEIFLSTYLPLIFISLSSQHMMEKEKRNKQLTSVQTPFDLGAVKSRRLFSLQIHCPYGLQVNLSLWTWLESGILDFFLFFLFLRIMFQIIKYYTFACFKKEKKKKRKTIRSHVIANALYLGLSFESICINLCKILFILVIYTITFYFFWRKYIISS